MTRGLRKSVQTVFTCLPFLWPRVQRRQSTTVIGKNLHFTPIIQPVLCPLSLSKRYLALLAVFLGTQVEAVWTFKMVSYRRTSILQRLTWTANI